MSTLLFLPDTTKNNDTKKYDQFIPTYTNPTLKSPPRVKKRKQRTSNGSSSKRRSLPPPLSSSSTSPLNDVSASYMPPSPTSSFSSFTSASSLSSPALSSLSFNSSGSIGDDTRKLPYFHQQYQSTTKDMDEKRKQLMTLENEMDFTQDAWATLNVMFESVRLAYLNSAPKMTPHPTRLDAMEKELLSAYDDLELQVIHLDRHIQKLESSWYRYKSNNNK